MGSILIVGNITKDVYLQLNERKNHFELDGNDVPWLDVKLDGATYPFIKQTQIFGGAAVSMETLCKFGVKAAIAGAGARFEDGAMQIARADETDYRYILCSDNHVAYLAPDKRKPSVWEPPTEAVDWIYVDRSACITNHLLQEIDKYLSVSQHTRLIVYVKPGAMGAERELARRANLLFTDDKEVFEAYPDKACWISDQVIKLSNVTREWQAERADLFTHLTTYSIVAASILGALLGGKSLDEALRLAQLNAENSSLDGTLDLAALEELAHNQYDAGLALRGIAQALVAGSKGILAADESGGSIHKKFERMGIVDDEQHRRDYRNVLITTPDLNKYVNGVILFDETARQRVDGGQNFVQFLTTQGIIPGIKVDQGLAEFNNAGEKYTRGLAGLPERLSEYYQMGLRFAKWRAAFEVRDDLPSDNAISKNCEILAQYAADCQAAGIVPIVEPEVVHDGDYSIEKCAAITGKVLDKLFEKLAVTGVDLAGCLLKCNMVLTGSEFYEQSTPEQVGVETAKILRTHVPKELAGVVFLSGGQSPEQATANLLSVQDNGPFPWPVTFSFARALQDPALIAWNGDNNNAKVAQEAFLARLRAVTRQ